VANALRGEAEFTVDGRAYKVRYSWNSAADFEDALQGRALSDALLDVAKQRLSAKSLRAMLWAGLQENHPEVTLKEAGDLIGRMGRREAQRVMGAALRYYFPELEEGKDPDPPKPAAA
jgi:hypothetical protein